MALLTVYLDETGHLEGPVCVVGGYAGIQENWKRFEQEWLHALKPRTALHMQALRWNYKRHRIERLLNRLGPIPRKHHLVPVYGAVRRDDYDSIVKGRLTDNTTANGLSPYMLCLQICLKGIMHSLPPGNEVFVYGEQQTTWEPWVQALNAAVFGAKKQEPRIIGFGFLGKGDTPLFQPADYLLYHLAHHAKDKHSYKAVATKPILGDGFLHGGYASRDQLETLVNGVNDVSDRLSDGSRA